MSVRSVGRNLTGHGICKTSSLSSTRPSRGTKPFFFRNSWPARLPQIFEANGLVDIEEDRRPLPNELLQAQLDTALMACEEVSYQAMDPLGGGRGDRTRELVAKCFGNRSTTAFNVDRLTVIGRKQLSQTSQGQ